MIPDYHSDDFATARLEDTVIRARLDAVQGISAAEREATSQPSLVAQRRARRAQK